MISRIDGQTDEVCFLLKVSAGVSRPAPTFSLSPLTYSFLTEHSKTICGEFLPENILP